ncbi:MAG: SDR family oxidoreductase [Dehalococcoidales bacterium]|nr:SDR family oxidoreductase [Dehalococcoidales bacterium]
MGKNLEGKVAVVAGSGQGIGRAIALQLASEGAKIVTNNRKPGSTGMAFITEKELNNLSEEDRKWLQDGVKEEAGDAETTANKIKEMGGEAIPFFGDMSDFAAAEQCIKTAVDGFGKIDILVNVVGTFGFSKIWEMSEETWDRVCGIKPKAHFNTIRHALPYMIDQKYGRIVNCTSGAFAGSDKHTNYATANAGVLGLTWSVAQEVYRFGITCNAFAPAAKTRAAYELESYVRAVGPEDSPMGYGKISIMAVSPPPEQLAPFVAYLTTEEAANISGSVFFLGGNSINMYGQLKMEKTLVKYGDPWTVDELKQQVPGMLRGYRSPAAPPPGS